MIVTMYCSVDFTNKTKEMHAFKAIQHLLLYCCVPFTVDQCSKAEIAALPRGVDSCCEFIVTFPDGTAPTCDPFKVMDWLQLKGYHSS